MMQPAKDRNCGDAADRLGVSQVCVLLQSQVSPDFVVIRSLALEGPAQVCLAEHDQVVQAFATN